MSLGDYAKCNPSCWRRKGRLAMAKRGSGVFSGVSTIYTDPKGNPYDASGRFETVRQTAARLEKSQRWGWLGSISIHGHLINKKKTK